MTNSKTNKTLVGTTLLVVAVFVVVGFFHFQNTFVGLLEPIYFAHGTRLSQQDADQLEQHVKFHPNSFSDRIELLAYYSFKNVGGGGLTPDQLANRREHILWIIQRNPSSSFASTYEASFGDDGRDPEGQRQGEALWSEQVQANPKDVPHPIQRWALFRVE